MIIIDTPIDEYSDEYRYGHYRTTGTGQLAEVELASNEEFLNDVLRKPKRLHYLSRNKFNTVNADNHECKYYGRGNSVSLGIQSLHEAFQAHIPFSLRPDTIWYMIVHEVAEHVRQNSECYADLFTETPGTKQHIEVRDDSLSYEGPSDWGRTINLFREPLTKKITAKTADLFLPTFSTTTVEDSTAHLVILMDAASPFYSYGVSTMCGIPRIRLEGDASDWNALQAHAFKLSQNFDRLSPYFSDLLPVLEKIARTAEGERDEEFWRSIYKFGGGSGGPYVSGWITALFAYVQTPRGLVAKDERQLNWRGLAGGWGGFTTDQFPSHVSTVEFKWNYFGTAYEMKFAAGVLGVDYDDDFLSPRLGFAVAEV